MANLIEFTCPKCQKKLVWALENSKVFCKTCLRWVHAKDIKNPNPAKLSDDSEQMTMF